MLVRLRYTGVLRLMLHTAEEVWTTESASVTLADVFHALAHVHGPEYEEELRRGYALMLQRGERIAEGIDLERDADMALSSDCIITFVYRFTGG